MTFPIVQGVSRDAENERVLLLSLPRELTDDEVRELHRYLNDVYCRSEFEFRSSRPRESLRDTFGDMDGLRDRD